MVTVKQKSCLFFDILRILKHFNFICIQTGGYAPVICNHAPHPRGIAGTFDFSSSKSLLDAPHCGDKLLVKHLLFDTALCGTNSR